MVADTTRYPEVEIEEKKIKRCLADARRSKGYNYYLDFGVARHVSRPPRGGGGEAAFEHLEDLEQPVLVKGTEGSAIIRQQGTLRIEIAVEG